jgi:xanthine dehydrogenase accessory factor
MDSVDLQVLKTAAAWAQQGHRSTLTTITRTWGSAPRPVGAMMLIRDDGMVVGSVSGGCVEDDLIERVKDGKLGLEKPEVTCFGVSSEDAARFGLPCGGKLELVMEPVLSGEWIENVLALLQRDGKVSRTLDLESGTVTVSTPTAKGVQCAFDGHSLTNVFGPRYRLLVIGAGQLSMYLAQVAQGLDYQVIVCDPREEYTEGWSLPGVELTRAMPDDAVLAMKPDAHSAVVALTHDPKLDDMALLEALKSPAFYVGALGSRANNAKRRERLKLFDLTEEQIGRLHGPIGLHIGSRTPPEIAISILAQLTSVKNGVAPGAERQGLAVAPEASGVCGA